MANRVQRRRAKAGAPRPESSEPFAEWHQLVATVAGHEAFSEDSPLLTADRAAAAAPFGEARDEALLSFDEPEHPVQLPPLGIGFAVAPPPADPAPSPPLESRASTAAAPPPPPAAPPHQDEPSSSLAVPPPSPVTAPTIETWAPELAITPGDPRLVLLEDPDSVRAACFRVLRHRLAQRGDPRVIVVSSAERREGKTTCAVNLALALAEGGHARVALIEANVRTPSLAAMFGFRPQPCFATQVLLHRDEPREPWEAAVITAHLHLMAMRQADAPRPILDGPSLGAALTTLRRAYDYLVVDTPPVLGSADVNLLEDAADGVLLVARSGRSTSRALRRAMEQLSPDRILGLALLDA